MTEDVDNHIYEKFDLQKRLGKGAYGIVWKAIDKRTKDVVALKKIFDAFRNPTDSQRTFREVMFLQEFGKHPNIIKLFNIFRADNDRDIYLTFEYMEADLHNVIKKGTILKDVHKQYIMAQLFRAIRFLHSGNVLHRDLKPSNVLLDADCRVKLADFGLARSLSSLEDYPEGQKMPDLTEYVATRWYRSPEILLAAKRYTKGVDMWSLGCILAEMLIGRALFPGSSTINQIERIMNTISKPTRSDIASIGSYYAASVLEKMPQRPRKPLEHILQNGPVAALDIIQRLLIFAPQRRLTVEQCLVHPYVIQFHNPSDEPTLQYEVNLPLPDHIQLSIDDYRNRLYDMIDEKKMHIRRIHHDRITDQGGRSRAPIAQAECSDTDYDTARSLARAASVEKNGSSYESSSGTLRERALSADSRGSKNGNSRSATKNGGGASIKQRRRSIESSQHMADNSSHRPFKIKVVYCTAKRKIRSNCGRPGTRRPSSCEATKNTVVGDEISKIYKKKIETKMKKSEKRKKDCEPMDTAKSASAPRNKFGYNEQMIKEQEDMLSSLFNSSKASHFSKKK